MMVAVTRDWAVSLDYAGVERVLSLGRYNRQAVLLFTNVDDLFYAATDQGKTPIERLEFFHFYFMPYYRIWVSMLYVVHEGVKECEVSDKKLTVIQDSIDMQLLRRFRNGTFHFKAKLSNPHHHDYIEKNGFLPARNLHERQDFVIRKMVRLLKHNMNFQANKVHQLD